MKISRRGLDLIKHFEGCELTAYMCPAQVWTIGIGTTVYFDSKKKVKAGDVISHARAEELLRGDLAKFEHHIEGLVKVKLSQDQFDALVSFCYNLGPTNLRSSTLLKLLNQGDYPLAAAEFRNWRKAGGRVLKGLERRRKAEEKLFCGCKNYLD